MSVVRSGSHIPSEIFNCGTIHSTESEMYKRTPPPPPPPPDKPDRHRVSGSSFRQEEFLPEPPPGFGTLRDASGNEGSLGKLREFSRHGTRNPFFLISR